MAERRDTSRAVRFSRYGGIDVLDVVEVETPTPETGQVLVAVRAAGINPGEASIREGRLHETWPATFPSGQGSDLAGTVAATGDEVTSFAVGDDVLGFTNGRASQAEYVVTEAAHVTHKPAGVPWTVAGALKVAGTTAWAANQAAAVREGDVVVVSPAAGGVGGLAAQLANLRGARVIGLASERNRRWLDGHGIAAVDYKRPDLADAIADAIRATHGHVDAFLDCFGEGYVELALELGVAPDRINTTADFEAAEKHGTHAAGESEASTAEVLASLAALLDTGRLELPIAATYPLTRVRDAYRELEERHTRGKIVLVPDTDGGGRR